MLKYFDDGKREEFLRLWSEHIPSNIIDSDSSLKSLEFLLYAHFAIYYIRPNMSNKVHFIFFVLLYLNNRNIFRMKKQQKKICKYLKHIWNQLKVKLYHKQVIYYLYLLYRMSHHQ